MILFTLALLQNGSLILATALAQSLAFFEQFFRDFRDEI